MTNNTFEHFPQPEWNDEDSVVGALDALRDAHEEAAADDATDRFLWAIGNARGRSAAELLEWIDDLEDAA